MSIHLKRLQVISELAVTSNDYRERIAAGLWYKGSIIASGRNQKKSHPFQKRFGRNEDSIYLHAEIDCMVDAMRQRVPLEIISKATLYVARVKKYHQDAEKYEWAMARPCEGCQRAIANFDIKKVIYTTNLGLVAPYDTL